MVTVVAAVLGLHQMRRIEMRVWLLYSLRTAHQLLPSGGTDYKEEERSQQSLVPTVITWLRNRHRLGLIHNYHQYTQ